MTGHTAPRPRVRNLMMRKTTDCHYCFCATVVPADPTRRHQRRRTIEHIVPVTMGLPEVHSVWNTVWACQKCNEGHVGSPEHCDACRSAWRNARHLAQGLPIAPDGAPSGLPVHGMSSYRFGDGWEVRLCEWCGVEFIATWLPDRPEHSVTTCSTEHTRLLRRERQGRRHRDRLHEIALAETKKGWA